MSSSEQRNTDDAPEYRTRQDDNTYAVLLTCAGQSRIVGYGCDPEGAQKIAQSLNEAEGF
jgi:hypothetical protein